MRQSDMNHACTQERPNPQIRKCDLERESPLPLLEKHRSERRGWESTSLARKTICSVTNFSLVTPKINLWKLKSICVFVPNPRISIRDCDSRCICRHNFYAKHPTNGMWECRYRFAAHVPGERATRRRPPLLLAPNRPSASKNDEQGNAPCRSLTAHLHSQPTERHAS